MNETRVTDAVTGGMKNQKDEQYSLVDPGFRLFAIETWPAGIRKELALAMLRFEEGFDSALADIVVLAQDLLIDACEGSRNVAVQELARQYGFGGRKYNRGNWRKGYAWSLTIDAFWRHLMYAYARDEESGNLHAAAVLWHACALRDFVLLGLGTDDRLYKASRYDDPCDGCPEFDLCVGDVIEVEHVVL